jgi:predicted Zn-dependent peptidase
MLNYVFGGQPTARLFMNLRQDKGYSYGYYSSIDWLTGPSALFAGGSVETGVTKESVIETLSEFAGIRGDRPVSTEEFQAARDGILQGFPGLFETNGQILQQLSNIAVFGLPDDYYSHVVANMEGVTLSETHRVAKERVDDEHLAVLVVGDREAVEPGLAEVGLPIVHVDYEGRRLSGS